MPLAVAITGTRSTGHRELSWYADLFNAYLAPFARDDAHFYIGGAVGIDSLSLLWLAGNSESRITIVTPGTVKQQPAEARQAIYRCHDRIAEIIELGAAELRTPAFHARNRWMVDHADMVIGLPLKEVEGTSGTWQTINERARQPGDWETVGGTGSSRQSRLHTALVSPIDRCASPLPASTPECDIIRHLPRRSAADF